MDTQKGVLMSRRKSPLVLGVAIWLLASWSVVFAQTNAENEGALPLVPPPSAIQAYGDNDLDIVFVPITPCRIIDTRNAGGPIAGGATRDFRVTGTNFTGQGGAAGSCGVPVGASAAFINFVAVGPQGGGDFRATAFGTAMPLASFLNYAAGANVANGVALNICKAPAVCTFDFTVQADVSPSDLVADVMGYFKPAPPAGRGWASVQPSGAFELARTRNFTAVSRPSTGVYCLTPAANLTLTNVPVSVTVEWGASIGFDLLAFPVMSPLPFTPCTGNQLQVRTYQFAAGGTPVLSNNVAFFVWVP